MPSEAHVCPIADIHLAAKTITSVLNTSPFISFLYNNNTPIIPPGKTEKLSIYLYRTLSTGLVLTVDDDDKKCVGVAVWQGPTRQSLAGRLYDWCVQAGFDFWDNVNTWYNGHGGLNQKRRIAADKVHKKVRREILGEGNEKDTWYLHMLAVSPEYQGQGIGKRLVKYVTDISDRDGTRCYLLTSLLKPNVAIYEQLGFSLMRTAKVSVDGIDFNFYCMLRVPQSQ